VRRDFGVFGGTQAGSRASARGHTITALERAGLAGKGAKAARELLARDPWPADLEVTAADGHQGSNAG
jgi:hypothetical protein